MPCHGSVEMAASETGAVVDAFTVTQCGAPVGSYNNEAFMARSTGNLHTLQVQNHQPSPHHVIDLTDKNDASQLCRKQRQGTKKRRSLALPLMASGTATRKRRQRRRRKEKKNVITTNIYNYQEFHGATVLIV